MKDLKHQIRIEVQEVRNFLIRMSAKNAIISDGDILAYVTNAHKPLSILDALELVGIETRKLSRQKVRKIIRKFERSAERVDRLIGELLKEMFYA